MGEFELIQRYFNRSAGRRGHSMAESSDLLLGIGDDAALLRPNGRESLVVSTDMLVAGRHFPRDTLPEAIGYRVLAVNLSDLAAMGARPAAVTLALSLPPSCTRSEWLEPFCAGFFGLAESHGVPLVGGDTVSADQLTVSVTAMGYVESTRALRRGGAKPGDLIAVTGTIGDAGLGLKCALAPDDVPQVLSIQERQWLRDRLDLPTPRIETGRALAEFAHAAIDISDGLLQDLGHVLTASGVGADLELERIPLSPAARHWFAEQPALALLPLGAGDDYELLFTCPPEAVDRLDALPVPATVIGRISAEPGLRLRDAAGDIISPPVRGYDHFVDHFTGHFTSGQRA